ncbi:hypothetical protein MRX96_031369 [Rhipicephalus microplus]
MRTSRTSGSRDCQCCWTQVSRAGAHPRTAGAAAPLHSRRLFVMLVAVVMSLVALKGVVAAAEVHRVAQLHLPALQAEILSSLEVSMFSYGSKEGIAGDISILDLAQLESERSQFQHNLQRLTKEKEDGMRQCLQLEEANQALAASNKGLLERVRSLCQEVEALRSASAELEETKAALAATSVARQEAEQHLVQARAAKAALESQLEKRMSEVDSLQEKLTKSEVPLREQLSQETSKLVESAAVVQDLSKTVETLEHRQKDTEDELRQQRVENLRLREALYEQNSVIVGDTSTITGTELHDTSPAAAAGEANLDSDEGVRSISPASVLLLDLSSSSSHQPISDELFFSALDLPYASTPHQESSSRISRLPFCGIPRLPSWDCSLIRRRHSDVGVLSPGLNHSGHSSLPSKISVEENVGKLWRSNLAGKA